MQQNCTIYRGKKSALFFFAPMSASLEGILLRLQQQDSFDDLPISQVLSVITSEVGMTLDTHNLVAYY